MDARILSADAGDGDSGGRDAMKRDAKMFIVIRKGDTVRAENVIGYSFQRRKAEKIKVANEPAEIVVYEREKDE